MAQRQTLEQLNVQAGDKLVIKGKVAFSEVAKRVEGEALARKIARQEQLGMKFPTTKPHYALSLVDVQIDPQYQGSALATFYGQQVYKNKKGQLAIGLESKSPFAPNVYHEQADGSALKIELPAEFAPGQEVSVLVEAFMPKQYNKLGSSFVAVMVPAGEIKYYSNAASSEIEAFGLKVSDQPVATVVEDSKPAPAEFGGVAETAQPEAQSTVADNPFATQANEPASPSGVVNNPFA